MIILFLWFSIFLSRDCVSLSLLSHDGFEEWCFFFRVLPIADYKVRWSYRTSAEEQWGKKFRLLMRQKCISARYKSNYWVIFHTVTLYSIFRRKMYWFSRIGAVRHTHWTFTSEKRRNSAWYFDLIMTPSDFCKFYTSNYLVIVSYRLYSIFNQNMYRFPLKNFVPELLLIKRSPVRGRNSVQYSAYLILATESDSCEFNVNLLDK